MYVCNTMCLDSLIRKCVGTDSYSLGVAGVGVVEREGKEDSSIFEYLVSRFNLISPLHFLNMQPFLLDFVV